MSVELEPAELGFKRPFTHEVSQVLRLANPHSQPLAFKVKTTAPKQYCVRPNSGRIEPSSTVEVQVLLQAMKEDPPLDAKCRDKFLVQSVIIPDAVASNPNIVQVWQSVESTAKGSIQERKIRVNFLPSDTQTNGVGAAGASHTDDLPPAYTHGASSAAVTPQKSAPVADEKSPSLIDQSMASVASATETVQNTAASTVSAVAAAVPTSSEQLQRQLDEAKATIVRLQQQATEGLRQRKVADGTSGTSTSAGSKLALQNQQVPGGVPVQLVAGLCLVSFIIAYLFF